MFSMQRIADAQATVTAATATGTITVASNAAFYPGAMAWIAGNDGVSYRVKIVSVVGATDMLVRQAHDNNGFKGPPNYGLTNMSGVSLPATIFQEAQIVEFIFPGNAKVSVP